jgi:hypothetical protein
VGRGEKASRIVLTSYRVCECVMQMENDLLDVAGEVFPAWPSHVGVPFECLGFFRIFTLQQEKRRKNKKRGSRNIKQREIQTTHLPKGCRTVNQRLDNDIVVFFIALNGERGEY